MLICKFCNKDTKNKNSLRNHERLCKNNPNRQISSFEKPEIQQKRKKSNQYIKGTAVPYGEDTINRLRKKSSEYWTPERRKALSVHKTELMKELVLKYPESYSYKNFCGRSKKTLYKNQWMHSSWELITAQWFDRNDIKWTKKVPGFLYKWEGRDRTYFPDFYLEEYDCYVEVKGYETDRDTAKWSSIPNLIVLKEKEINDIKKNKFIFGQIS